MKQATAVRNLSRWLLAAAFAFAMLTVASAVQLRSQTPSVSAVGCNSDYCANDSQCEGGQDNHKLCDACQSDYGGPNICGTFE